jgi:hypothetical protein
MPEWITAEDAQADAGLRRKRKIAKERIVEQFGDALADTGQVVVDCGSELGHALVTTDDVGCYVVEWLESRQVGTLAGRID